MDLKESVVQRFGEAAARYAASPVHAGGPNLEALLEEAQAGPGARVLDLACGPGHTALAFAARGCEVVGIDLAEPMLEQARALAAARGLPVRYQRADVEALPFADASFDRVVTRFAAHHFPDPAAALREAARVVRPGGRFLLVDCTAPEDPTQDTFLNAIEVVRDPSHVRDWSVSEWLALSAAAGLDARCTRRWPLHLDFDAWIARQAAPELAARALRAMFLAAPVEVRRAFGMERGDEPSFTIPVALVQASTRSPRTA